MKVLDAYAGLMAADIAADRMAKIKIAGIENIGVCVGGIDRARAEALLPRAGADVPDRVRQHAERRQSRALGLARLQRRLRPRSAARASEDVTSLISCNSAQLPRSTPIAWELRMSCMRIASSIRMIVAHFFWSTAASLCRRRQRAPADHRSLRSREVDGAGDRRPARAAVRARARARRHARTRFDVWPIASCCSCTGPARRPKWHSTCRIRTTAGWRTSRSAGFDVFSVDMTGYGRSTRPGGDERSVQPRACPTSLIHPASHPRAVSSHVRPGADDDRVRLGRRRRGRGLHPRAAPRGARQPRRVVAGRPAFRRLRRAGIRKRCIVSCCSHRRTVARAAEKRQPRFRPTAWRSTRSRARSSMRTGTARSAAPLSTRSLRLIASGRR